MLSIYCMQCVSVMRNSSALFTSLRYQAMSSGILVKISYGKEDFFQVMDQNLTILRKLDLEPASGLEAGLLFPSPVSLPSVPDEKLLRLLICKQYFPPHPPPPMLSSISQCYLVSLQCDAVFLPCYLMSFCQAVSLPSYSIVRTQSKNGVL